MSNEQKKKTERKDNYRKIKIKKKQSNIYEPTQEGNLLSIPNFTANNQ